MGKTDTTEFKTHTGHTHRRQARTFTLNLELQASTQTQNTYKYTHKTTYTDTFVIPGEDPSTLGLPSGQREVKMQLGEHVADSLGEC